MSSDALVTLAIGGFIALVMGLGALGFWNMYWRLPTFDEYRRRHPGLVKNGRLRCNRCAGGRVFLYHLTEHHRRHLCATCGAVLYRS